MKYIIILGDGMADEPLAELAGKTPLAYARTPMMDILSKKGEIGMVQTIPAGMSPGSDTANLSVLGFDPRIYYSGRSPLEALSIGIPLAASDIAIRCNMVTLSEEAGPFAQRTIIDHSADEISTEESAVLLEAVKKELRNELYDFYAGTSYRHCLIWHQGRVAELTPPHDILGKVIAPYLPDDPMLLAMMEKSYQILAGHPLNGKRRERGRRPANCCWFWGAGTKPALTGFFEKTGKKGLMVSAVDLLKGIAIGAGMGVARVEGATGGLHTNYAGKTEAAVTALLQDGYDFAYIHVEAPDEMGHQGSAERKIKAIEYLDEKVIAPLVEQMERSGQDYRLLIMPDHPTPVRLRTHTGDSVPYLLYDSTVTMTNSRFYNEKEAAESGNFIEKGHIIIDKLFQC